jgi:hypothetical protein
MWHKRELKVHNNPVIDLAAAVIRQWNVDGRPRGDADGVQVWADLISAHAKTMRTGVPDCTINVSRTGSSEE